MIKSLVFSMVVTLGCLLAFVGAMSVVGFNIFGSPNEIQESPTDLGANKASGDTTNTDESLEEGDTGTESSLPATKLDPEEDEVPLPSRDVLDRVEKKLGDSFQKMLQKESPINIIEDILLDRDENGKAKSAGQFSAEQLQKKFSDVKDEIGHLKKWIKKELPKAVNGKTNESAIALAVREGVKLELDKLNLNLADIQENMKSLAKEKAAWERDRTNRENLAKLMDAKKQELIEEQAKIERDSKSLAEMIKSLEKFEIQQKMLKDKGLEKLKNALDTMKPGDAAARLEIWYSDPNRQDMALGILRDMDPSKSVKIIGLFKDDKRKDEVLLRMCNQG